METQQQQQQRKNEAFVGIHQHFLCHTFIARPSNAIPLRRILNLQKKVHKSLPSHSLYLCGVFEHFAVGLSFIYFLTGIFCRSVISSKFDRFYIHTHTHAYARITPHTPLIHKHSGRLYWAAQNGINHHKCIRCLLTATATQRKCP